MTGVRRVLFNASLVIVHLFLATVAFLVYTNIQQQTVSKRWSESNSYLLSKLIIARQEQNFVFAKQLAVTLAEIPVVKNHDVEGCNETFARILKENPVYANLGVADTKGNNWCSAVPMQSPIDVSDRSHYQEALANKTFALGQYAIGRIVHKPVVHAAYPVIINDNVTGVVLLVIDLDWLNKLIANTDLPTGSRAGIYDNSGTLLAHYPTQNDLLGTNINTTYLKGVSQKDLYPSAFATFASSKSEETKHVYTVSRFPDNVGKGIYFFVGIPKAFFDSISNQIVRENIIPLFIFIIVFAVTVLVDLKLISKNKRYLKLNHNSKSPNSKLK